MSAWHDALGAATPDPDAQTIAELCAALQMSAWAVRIRVRALVAAGKAVQTVKMTSRGRVTAYRLVEPAKKAKRAA